MPAFLKEQQIRPNFNGHLCHNFGPPIGLFYPIFDSFQPAKDDEPILIDAETYVLIRNLFEAIYNDKDKRIDAIDKDLSILLGTRFVGGSASSGVLSDGVIIPSTGPYNVYLAVHEVKMKLERPARTHIATAPYPTVRRLFESSSLFVLSSSTNFRDLAEQHANAKHGHM